MPVDLGAEFLPSRELAPPAPDPAITLLQEIRAVLTSLPTLIAAATHIDIPPQPAPVVHLPPPDLSAIVTAVNSLKPNATPAAIAREITAQLNPQPVTENSLMADAMRELVDKIDFRLQGVGRAFGSSGPSNIADNPNRLLGHVTVDSMPAIVTSGTVDVTDRSARLLGVVAPADGAPLEYRLLNKQPLSGDNLWYDTADTSFLYILEAPFGTAAGSTGFEGIRLPLDANGNIVGQIQRNTGATLSFNNRKTDGGWG